MKYRALAYIGLYELANLGTFETRCEALDALEAELQQQMEYLESVQLDGNLPYEDRDALSEVFYFNSRVDEIE